MYDGPEFVSIALAGWAENDGIHLDFIKPGKPTQNSYDERCNRSNRDEILDLYLFSSLAKVRTLTNEWMRKYNEQSWKSQRNIARRFLSQPGGLCFWHNYRSEFAPEFQ